VQLLDFGHSDIFPGTDTFPSILIADNHRRDDPDSSQLLVADVSDRIRHNAPLPAYVEEFGFSVSLTNLKETGWVLEPTGANQLLDKLETKYPKLADFGSATDVLLGVMVGMTDAFYISTAMRDHLVSQDPNCETLIRKMLRGRTVKRWRPDWNGDWVIAIPSSSNRDWPWSHCKDERQAEDIFAQAYPALHQHLKAFEPELRQCQNQGRFWWELRSCNYLGTLERPKIVVQQILYHSVFALDTERYWVNAKVYFLPTDDRYLLALLNSRIMWWYIYRKWTHMKDEALTVQKQKVLSLPIPEVTPDLRSQIENLVDQAGEIARDVSGQIELLVIERALDACVIEAYGLTKDEVAIIERTLPPRDPLAVLEARVQAQTVEKV
jgi:hypothetical protein